MITKNNFLNCIRRDFDRFDFCLLHVCNRVFETRMRSRENVKDEELCHSGSSRYNYDTSIEILFTCSSNKNRSWHSNILAYWTGKYSVLSAKRMKSDRKFAMELFCENQRNQENFLDTRFITNCFFIK